MVFHLKKLHKSEATRKRKISRRIQRPVLLSYVLEARFKQPAGASFKSTWWNGHQMRKEGVVDPMVTLGLASCYGVQTKWALLLRLWESRIGGYNMQKEKKNISDFFFTPALEACFSFKTGIKAPWPNMWVCCSVPLHVKELWQVKRVK